MEAKNNTNGTGGAPNLAPHITTARTKNGSWQAIAYNEGKWYSANTCKRKADAIEETKKDLRDKGIFL